MMHLFINSLAASAGGGLTYIRNVLPEFAAMPEVKVTVALTNGLRRELADLTHIDFVELNAPPGRRFWFEQSALPRLIQSCGATALLSTGNFALRKSPVPQILLSRNSIYTSADFYRDLRQRYEYRMWLETRLRAVLARESIRWADITVAPSEAFAAELTRWSSRRVIAIHHGFNRSSFFGDATPLPENPAAALKELDGTIKLLFVSHYNYYRNFETLIRALPLLRNNLPGRKFKLLLTCQLKEGANPGSYDARTAAKLIQELGVSDLVVELGTIPYSGLHHLYALADVYISPAYTETFAHPLVEAMASGVPVVASDLPVHHEICGSAGAYFSKFSPPALTDAVLQILRSPGIRSGMAEAGKRRSQQFSWRAHVQHILQVATRLTAASGSGTCAGASA
jgi:glycosyltransferase involved in cell wall biosynthesis